MARWHVALMIAVSGIVRAEEPPPEAEVPPAPVSTEIYVYASQGQSDKQLDRDRYECHQWSVTQTGFNPSDSPSAPPRVPALALPPPGREAAAGAISGAITGAILAGPHDTAEGAFIGAFAGGALAALSESARRKEIRQVNAHSNAQAQDERARLEQRASNYRRAIGACLEGRGYTVK